MTDLARAPKSESGLSLAMVVEMTGFSAAEIALVSRSVAQGAPLQELAVFLHSCRALGLDPLLRQAYWIRRRSREQDPKTKVWSDVYKGTLQVGIDGFRAIAERSGVYAGAESIEYRGQLEWTYKDAVLIVPELARAVLWKVVAGHKSAFVGEAYWTEFAPAEAQAQMWAKMPRLMLGKCAEAQALRRAFPAQLGGVDMDAALGESMTSVTEVQQPDPKITREHNAQRYEQIFGAAYDDEPKPKAQPEATPQASPEEDPDDDVA